MVGFRNPFSKVSLGVVGQVANDVEAAPLKNRESPQVIRCGRF